MKQSKVVSAVDCLFEEHVFEIFAKYRLYVKITTTRNRFKPAQEVSKQYRMQQFYNATAMVNRKLRKIFAL